MAKPKYRIVAKNKTSGKYTELFAIWPSQHIEGAFNLTVSSEAPEVLGDKAVAALKDHFLNLYDNEGKGGNGQKGNKGTRPQKGRTQTNEDVADEIDDVTDEENLFG